MSNERTITITVLASQKDLALDILGQFLKAPDDENDFLIQADPALHFMQYYESTVRQVTEPLMALKHAGIAWDLEYGRTDDGESEPGEDRLRFTETGEVMAVGWTQTDLFLAVHDLMQYLDHPDKLREYIIEASKKTMSLPWTNQEEYGKRHMAAQLLLQGVEQPPLV